MAVVDCQIAHLNDVVALTMCATIPINDVVVVHFVRRRGIVLF